MLTARTALLLTLLLTFSLHHATAHFTPVECCFEYAEKAIRHVKGIYLTPPDCPKAAVVIVTSTDDRVCVDPKKRWVKNAMKKLETKI